MKKAETNVSAFFMIYEVIPRRKSQYFVIGSHLLKYTTLVSRILSNKLSILKYTLRNWQYQLMIRQSQYNLGCIKAF